MARREPAAYTPPPLDLDHRPFDTRATRRILGEAGVRASPDAAALREASQGLNRAAQWLRLQDGLRAAPTEGDERRTLERLGRLAAALRAELPVTWEASLHEEDGPGENPRAVDGVTRLIIPTMTRLMRERVERERDERGRGPEAEEIFGAANAADVLLQLTATLDLVAAAADAELAARRGRRSVKTASPLEAFVLSAGQVYLDLTGETKLSLSRKAPGPDGGRLQGPLIRFLEGCCRQVGAAAIRHETLADWVRQAQRRARARAADTLGNRVELATRFPHFDGGRASVLPAGHAHDPPAQDSSCPDATPSVSGGGAPRALAGAPGGAGGGRGRHPTGRQL